jgi:hypothetical protein
LNQKRRLFPPAPAVAQAEHPRPDWPQIHQALQRKGVTLMLLSCLNVRFKRSSPSRWDSYLTLTYAGWFFSGIHLKASAAARRPWSISEAICIAV